jgi:hypothetical protein
MRKLKGFSKNWRICSFWMAKCEMIYDYLLNIMCIQYNRLVIFKNTLNKYIYFISIKYNRKFYFKVTLGYLNKLPNNM